MRASDAQILSVGSWCFSIAKGHKRELPLANRRTSSLDIRVR